MYNPGLGMLESYFPILVFGALGIAVGAAFSVLNFVLGPRRPGKETSSTRRQADPYECGLPSEVSRTFRFGAGFYMVAMLFILFDIMVVFLYPVGSILAAAESFVILGVILTFVAVLLAAFAYVWRKGALDWR